MKAESKVAGVIYEEDGGSPVLRLELDHNLAGKVDGEKGKSQLWWRRWLRWGGRMAVGAAILAPVLLAAGWFYLISINPTPPPGFPEKNFRVITTRELGWGGFYDGDKCFSRIETQLPPKAAMQAIISSARSNPALRSVYGPMSFAPGRQVALENTLSVLRYPPVTPPPATAGWTLGYQDLGIGYTHIYVWPKPDGGTTIDLFEGVKL